MIHILDLPNEEATVILTHLGTQVPEDEQERQIKRLTIDSFQTRMITEQSTKEHMIQQLESLQNAIGTMHIRLGFPAPVITPPSQDATLASQITKFEALLSQVQQEVQESEQKRKDLQLKVSALRMELEFEPSTFEEFQVPEDLSCTIFEQLNTNIASLQGEKDKRFEMITALVNGINAAWEQLQPQTFDSFEAQINALDVRGIGPAASSIAKLEEKLQTLQGTISERTEEKKRMQSEVEKLWNFLSTPETERAYMYKQHQGISSFDMDAWKGAEDGLSQQWKARRLECLESAYEALVEAWDELGVVSSVRESAVTPWSEHMDLSAMSDALLTSYQEELSKLQGELQSKRPILKVIERRAKLQEEMMAEGGDEQKHSDIRMRKLPKVVDQLRQGLVAWEKSHKEHFMYQGHRLLTTINEEEAEMLRARKEEIAKKKKAHAMQVEQEMYGTVGKAVVKARPTPKFSLKGVDSAMKAFTPRPRTALTPIQNTVGSESGKTKTRPGSAASTPIAPGRAM